MLLLVGSWECKWVFERFKGMRDWIEIESESLYLHEAIDFIYLL